MGTSNVDDLDRMRNETLSFCQHALLAAERHLAAERPCLYTFYSLGLPAAGFSAIAGVTGLAQIRQGYVAGIISIVVTVLTALMAFIDPSKRANGHHTAAKDYEAFYHDADVFYKVGSLRSDWDIEEKNEEFEWLSDTLRELRKDSPVISRYALRRADRLIGKGEVRDYDSAAKIPIAS